MNGPAIRLMLTALVAFLGFFFTRLYCVQSHVQSLQKPGLVGPFLLHL